MLIAYFTPDVTIVSCLQFYQSIFAPNFLGMHKTKGKYISLGHSESLFSAAERNRAKTAFLRALYILLVLVEEIGFGVLIVGDHKRA